MKLISQVVITTSLASAAYVPAKSWLMDYTHKALCKSNPKKDWEAELKKTIDSANTAAAKWQKDDNARDEKKRLLLEASWRDGHTLPGVRAALAWTGHKGKKHSDFVKSDLGKITKPAMEKIKKDAGKKKANLSSCDNSFGAEYQMHAKLGISYVNNIETQYNWFNSLDDYARRHVAETILGYTNDTDFVSKKGFYTKPGKFVQTFKDALKHQVRQAYGSKDTVLDGAMGGDAAIREASEAIYRTLGKHGQPSNARSSDMLKITSTMPMLKGPLMLFRMGTFNNFKGEKIAVGGERIAPMWESTMAFYGKGDYEHCIGWEHDNDYTVTVIPDGVKVPGIMVGRHFNAKEKDFLPFGGIMTGVNLLEVILPPGTVTTVREDSTPGLLNKHLFEHSPEFHGFPGLKKNSKGKVRVYEVRDWVSHEKSATVQAGEGTKGLKTDKAGLGKKYAKHKPNHKTLGMKIGK